MPTEDQIQNIRKVSEQIQESDLPGTGNVRFATKENTGIFYFKTENPDPIDYPSRCIGTITPSFVRFTKAAHYYDLMGELFNEIRNNQPSSMKIVDGQNNEYGVLEFFMMIQNSKMIIFENPSLE